MADVKKFPLVAKRYAALAKAVVQFRQAVASAADATDAVRLTMIERAMPDMAALHGTLTAIARTEAPGTDFQILGGGETPEEKPK